MLTENIYLKRIHSLLKKSLFADMLQLAHFRYLEAKKFR